MKSGLDEGGDLHFACTVAFLALVFFGAPNDGHHTKGTSVRGRKNEGQRLNSPETRLRDLSKNEEITS